MLPGSTGFFQTDAADPYIRYVKEKFSEESGVFVGNGSSLFGREGYASLMGVPMIENNESKGFVIALKKMPVPLHSKCSSCFRRLSGIPLWPSQIRCCATA